MWLSKFVDNANMEGVERDSRNLNVYKRVYTGISGYIRIIECDYK